MKLRAALAAFAVLPLSFLSAAAQDAADFDALQRAGFREVRAVPASSSAGSPAAAPIAVAPADLHGVFLQSNSAGGPLFFCSASGCRRLAEGAYLVLLAAPGSLYFTGPNGTGWCSAAGCRTLLPGRVVFPLTARKDGDVYATDAATAWHCTPDACAPASSQPLQRYNNYVAGVERPGAFASSSGEGTFWCADGKCARVSDREMVLFDDNCEGTPPAKAVYGFAGPEIFRCGPSGCAKVGEDSRVDNYVECSFDKSGKAHLPLRAVDGGRARGSVVCGASCAVSAEDLALTRRSAAGPARSSEFFFTGDDGAVYRLQNHQSDAEPKAGAPRDLNAAVAREQDGRSAALSFDVPAPCWHWIQGDEDDDDEVPSMWENHCRLMR
jgi:hypothetical protein